MDIRERIARLSPERLAVLERLLRASNRPARKIVPRAGERRRLPLSFAQQRLWFLDRLLPGGSLYNVAAEMQYHGAFDLDALGRTMNEIVRRHEALRTTFHAFNGQPEQVIEPSARVDLAFVDLGTWPVSLREAEARRLAIEESERNFDLERGPLLRA